MAEEAVQTPQGEVGASESVEQSAAVEEVKNTSLLGSDVETDEESKPETDGAEKPDGEAEAKPEGDDEGTEAEEEEKADGPPEKYEDFKVPEGMNLDAAAVEKVAPVFKELNLSQDQAQKLVDQYAELQQSALAEQKKAIGKMREEWAKEIKSDPEWKQKLSHAKKAVETFGDEELKSLLYDEWLGDQPALVRFLGKVGAATGNDKFIEGKSGSDDRAILDRIYDKMG